MEKEKKPKEIELRSEAFQEIVEQSPRWLIRSGISLIFGFVILLLVGSYFFKYPDVIEASITVSVENQMTPTDSLANMNADKSSGIHTQITGKVILAPKDARKVAVGQKVNIEFEDYPSLEYGYLVGSIHAITSNPNDENTFVEVELPQDMVTKSNIPLQLNHQLKGTAKIITEDLRLIERFINPIKSKLNRQNPTSH
jgi:hypothetical protein